MFSSHLRRGQGNLNSITGYKIINNNKPIEYVSQSYLHDNTINNQINDEIYDIDSLIANSEFDDNILKEININSDTYAVKKFLDSTQKIEFINGFITDSLVSKSKVDELLNISSKLTEKNYPSLPKGSTYIILFGKSNINNKPWRCSFRTENATGNNDYKDKKTLMFSLIEIISRHIVTLVTENKNKGYAVWLPKNKSTFIYTTTPVNFMIAINDNLRKQCTNKSLTISNLTTSQNSNDSKDNNSNGYTNWWIWVILGIFVLLAFGGGIFIILKEKNSKKKSLSLQSRSLASTGSSMRMSGFEGIESPF